MTLVWTLLLNVDIAFYDCNLVVLPLILMTHALGGTAQLRRFPLFLCPILPAFAGALASQAIVRVSGLPMHTLLLLPVAVLSMNPAGQGRGGAERPD